VCNFVQYIEQMKRFDVVHVNWTQLNRKIRPILFMRDSDIKLKFVCRKVKGKLDSHMCMLQFGNLLFEVKMSVFFEIRSPSEIIRC